MNNSTKSAIYARCSNIYDYWLVSRRVVNGQEFVIERYGKDNTGWPGNRITFGTDYYVDGLLVEAAVFDRALHLCSQ